MVCLLGSSSQESEGVGRHDEEKEGCPCLYKEEYVKFCKNLFLYIVRGHHHAYTGLVLLHTGRDTGKENGTPAAIRRSSSSRSEEASALPLNPCPNEPQASLCVYNSYGIEALDALDWPEKDRCVAGS